MVARMKTKGIQEIRTLRKRALQLASLRRINKGDADNVVKMLDDLEAYIVKMPEKPITAEDRDFY